MKLTKKNSNGYCNFHKQFIVELLVKIKFALFIKTCKRLIN